MWRVHNFLTIKIMYLGAWWELNKRKWKCAFQKHIMHTITFVLAWDSLIFILFYFYARPHIAQAVPKLTMLLRMTLNFWFSPLRPPECQGYKHGPLSLTYRDQTQSFWNVMWVLINWATSPTTTGLNNKTRNMQMTVTQRKIKWKGLFGWLVGWLIWDFVSFVFCFLREGLSIT